ncbi:unnamed protein product (macronuclear) [Paramecium tetraurelia]|uniref:Uncharacterized protein n=1 Tax=Paramecium tetraurelia TaxID=5888 RepID=A0D9T2_PARTE|nr:uncharacterized protein GSPATT00014730001 [Paramecium tetraurelia]CAK79799.1 unnamed protein product [Paramecium tetraurelia]|eukprot:XP_001447196.1 hypothetical protein (macronuclear) [Paramecium tetraurelia strain d4-2]
MKDFKYESYLTYTYNRPIKEMKRILELENFQTWDFNQQQKIVKYTINNSISIKLSYLLLFIEADFLRFSLAQIIQLGINIYNKYKQLENNQIQHKYLSSDRIYLQFENESQAMSILPQELRYSIHFTGYDCPFYELENQDSVQKSDEQSVKEIITHILQVAKNKFKEKYKKMLQKQNGTERFQQILQAEEEIYQKIYNEGICISLEQFINKSNDIFTLFDNSNNQRQLLIGIDLRFDEKIFWRKFRSKQVSQNIVNIVQSTYSSLKWIRVEQLLIETIPLIMREVKESYIYSDQIQAQNRQFINLQLIIGCMDMEDINIQIDKLLKKAQITYKFDIDKQIIFQKTISSLPDRLNILNYFYNNINFQIENNQKLIKLIDNLKQKLLNQIVEENIKEQIDLNIIQLLEEMF